MVCTGEKRSRQPVRGAGSETPSMARQRQWQRRELKRGEFASKPNWSTGLRPGLALRGSGSRHRCAGAQTTGRCFRRGFRAALCFAVRVSSCLGGAKQSSPQNNPGLALHAEFAAAQKFRGVKDPSQTTRDVVILHSTIPSAEGSR